MSHPLIREERPVSRPPQQTADQRRLSRFPRTNFEDEVTRIGNGLLGAKVEALLQISHALTRENEALQEHGVRLSIPHMYVIATDHYDQFVSRNHLRDLPYDDMSDREIAAAWVDGVLPTELLLHLYAIVETCGIPLAVRPSRLTPLPFSFGADGLHHCKMVPNNEVTIESRVDTLREAVKLVYASSFFRSTRDHLKYAGRDAREEKTAIVIQEVTGRRHGDLFFPMISGALYSHNFFPRSRSGLYDGSASLMFGLGEGHEAEAEKPWCYALSAPAQSVPFTSARHKLSSTQKSFNAINFAPARRDRLDPFEFIKASPIDVADDVPEFPLVSSTYDAPNDRFVPGTGNRGPRVVDFAPLLVLKARPLNDALIRLKARVEEALFSKIAMSFTVTHEEQTGTLQINLLQATPLFIHTMRVDLDNTLPFEEDTILYSDQALGNGVVSPITDIVYVDPGSFSCDKGAQAVQEVAAINQKLVCQNRRYIFIAMGRIGTSDPFRGLQVAWHQISGARVFVETDLPDAPADFSRGNHFFSDLVSCGSVYLYAPMKGPHHLDFERLEGLELVERGAYIRHVRSPVPLKVLVDGRTQRGAVLRDASNVRLHS